MELLTDEQFLAETGIPSVPSLKKVMESKIVLPAYTPLATGGRERRWPSDRVALARLVVLMADGSGLSLQAAAKLLDGLSPAWCAEAAQRGVEEARRILVGNRIDLWHEVDYGIFSRVKRIDDLMSINSLLRLYSNIHILDIT